MVSSQIIIFFIIFIFVILILGALIGWIIAILKKKYFLKSIDKKINQEEIVKKIKEQINESKQSEIIREVDQNERRRKLLGDFRRNAEYSEQGSKGEPTIKRESGIEGKIEYSDNKRGDERSGELQNAKSNENGKDKPRSEQPERDTEINWEDFG